MYHNYPTPKSASPWSAALLEAAVTILAFAVIAAATWLFCWSFFIPFHGRYVVGAILTVLMAKWLVFRKR